VVIKTNQIKTNEMKKIVITLSLMLAVIAQSFAADPTVSASLQKEFEARFARAKDVSWSQAEGFSVAAFTQYGKKLFAYFNSSNELVVVAEPINLQMLPEEALASLVEEHPDYTIAEVYKMRSDDGVRYHAVLKNEKEKVFVTSTGKQWAVAKRIKK
jgi:hypothetical protein